jgi:hypothetical protein
MTFPTCFKAYEIRGHLGIDLDDIARQRTFHELHEASINANHYHPRPRPNCRHHNAEVEGKLAGAALLEKISFQKHARSFAELEKGQVKHSVCNANRTVKFRTSAPLRHISVTPKLRQNLADN